METTIESTDLAVIEPEIVQEPVKERYKIKPRWKPGESGNPLGRPKGIREALIKHLRETVKEGKYKGNKRLVEALNRLYKEDLKTYFAYAYGKPVETHLLATMDGARDQVNPAALAIAREIAKDLTTRKS